MNMIDNSTVIGESDKVKIETTYEEYESQIIKKCSCICANPLSYKEPVTRNRLVECKFLDGNDALIYSIRIPNELAYHGLFSTRQGPSLLQDKYAIICGYSKGDTTCYDLKTGNELWRSNAEKVTELFVYKDKIYASWSAQKGGLYRIDARSGHVIEHCFRFKSELQAPITKRLNERYLVTFILGYFFIFDMETEKILLSEKNISTPGQFFSLSKIEGISSEGNVNFIFKDIIISKDMPAHMENSKISIPLSDLFNGAIISPFGDKIPTTKEQIDKKRI